MITGFNTDVEHDGVVYHVQTEDKGLDSPLILSLVYSGGAILASKRSRYEDLVAAGFDEAALAQRLKRQHRLICAAINAGRIDDLKRMGDRAAETDDVTAEIPAPLIATADDAPGTELPAEIAEAADTPAEPEIISQPKVPASAYTVHDARRHSPLGEKAAAESGLLVTMVGEKPFRSGESVTMKVLVQRRSGSSADAVVHAAVSIKILGTAFRPQMYSVTTGRDGLATVSTQIPAFNSGRAAVIIRVDAAGASYETRRVIQPGT
ncbi:MAG TPA: hypothetical protein VJT50_04770 [Pyrinomonadaceae bacterium]|nr:hypothetical protein [Pyrinomonadaceae bacterium]